MPQVTAIDLSTVPSRAISRDGSSRHPISPQASPAPLSLPEAGDRSLTPSLRHPHPHPCIPLRILACALFRPNCQFTSPVHPCSTRIELVVLLTAPANRLTLLDPRRLSDNHKRLCVPHPHDLSQCELIFTLRGSPRGGSSFLQAPARIWLALSMPLNSSRYAH